MKLYLNAKPLIKVETWLLEWSSFVPVIKTRDSRWSENLRKLWKLPMLIISIVNRFQKGKLMATLIRFFYPASGPSLDVGFSNRTNLCFILFVQVWCRLRAMSWISMVTSTDVDSEDFFNYESPGFIFFFLPPDAFKITCHLLWATIAFFYSQAYLFTESS